MKNGELKIPCATVQVRFRLPFQRRMVANLTGFAQALNLNLVHQPGIGMPATFIGAKRTGGALPLHHGHTGIEPRYDQKPAR